MIVRFHSPLPPAPSGVADYSAALLRELRKSAEVHVNPSEPGPGIDLYHLGNNPLHAAVYRQAVERPGVVVLHDAVLQHYLLGALQEAAYIEEFVHNYGEWHRSLAESLWRDRSHAGSDSRYFEWPMLRRVAESALAVIVHNPAAAEAVRRHAPEARVEEIPHLFDPPEQIPPSEVARLRASWKLPADALVFGVFGYLRETKRIPSILRALERVRRTDDRAALLLSGSFASEDLERTLAPLTGRPGVIRRGHLSERDFWVHASAVDVCVNLRVPSAAESSGIATRLMGIGKAVCLTAGPEITRLPTGTHIPVDAGWAEEEELTAYFEMFLRDASAAPLIGEAARRHITRRHALPEVARQYLEALRRAAESRSGVTRADALQRDR